MALAVILALVFLLSLLLDKTLRALPIKELRRRARTQHSKPTAAIYKLAGYGRSSAFFLHLCGALSASGLILLASIASSWAGFILAFLALVMVWVSPALASVSGWQFWLARIIAPLFSAPVGFLQPVLGRLTKWLDRLAPTSPPTKLYEKEDLEEFLKTQARLPDNRISLEELKTAHGALALSNKTVGDVMLPKRKIKWVAAGDPIGPMVMDELHKSGQSRFPVVKEITKAANQEVIGSLYLNDLLDHLEDKGRIRDIMHPGTNYINEEQGLRSVFDGFLKSGQLLLVVVNNFEEVVGVLTLDDVVIQIFGDRISGEFDRYRDIRSVATHNNHQTRGQANDAGVE